MKGYSHTYNAPNSDRINTVLGSVGRSNTLFLCGSCGFLRCECGILWCLSGVLLERSVKRFNIWVVGVKKWKGVSPCLAYKKLLDAVFGLGKVEGQMRWSVASLKMEDLDFT